MKKASLAVTFLILSVSSLGAVIGISETAPAATFHVGGSGLGNYTTIQGAIDDANPGDTVYIHGGTYHESIVIDKTLSLIGEDRLTTTIDSRGTSTVVEVSSDWVNITGFAVVGGRTYGIGLSFAENCYLADNIVSESSKSFYLWHSNRNTIADNIVEYGFSGVYMDSSDYNDITNNTFVENGVGIYSYLSNWNNLTNNDLSSLSRFNGFVSRGDGIEFEYSSNNTITDNMIYDNDIDITFRFSYDNAVANNSILLSASRGLSLHGSRNNRIFHNNFADNGEHVWDDSLYNQYDNGYPSGGNYWDNYFGIDEKKGPNQDQAGGDGIGDSPYDIRVGAGVDRYPLMNPTGPIEPPPDTHTDQESNQEQVWFFVAVACMVAVVLLSLAFLVRRRKRGTGS